jgi:hypothetical protein
MWEFTASIKAHVMLLIDTSISSLPTFVTEHSSSLLDLVLVNNPHSILYSEVGPPLLDQTRYHMPTNRDELRSVTYVGSVIS